MAGPGDGTGRGHLHMGSIDIERIAALRAAAIAEGADAPFEVRAGRPASKEYMVALFSMAGRLIAAARGDAEGGATAEDLDRLTGLRARASAEGGSIPLRIKEGRPAAAAYVREMLMVAPALVEAARGRAGHEPAPMPR